MKRDTDTWNCLTLPHQLSHFSLRCPSSPRFKLSLAGKWNEWGFRPPLCTYRLNRARRTSWGCWDEWDDTALQTQYWKFESWRSEAEHTTSRSRRLPTISNLYEWARRKHLFLWNFKAIWVGFERAISDFPSRQLFTEKIHVLIIPIRCPNTPHTQGIFGHSTRSYKMVIS